MKKVLLWGMGNDYELMLNNILFEIYKGNITIEGIICKDRDRYCSFRDGFRVLSKEDIMEYEFDYIVVTSLQYFGEIKKEAIAYGIRAEKIIKGDIFRLPLFDFGRYASLIENPVTILSDDCWGGYVYNRLELPFSSPLINIRWNRGEYAKFIQNPVFYLNTELRLAREGDIKKGKYPIGILGEGEREVELELVHNIDFEEALKQWNRRKARINYNNLFVKMGFSSDLSEEKKEEYISAFDKVHYKKILFYYGDEQVDGIFKTNRFIWKQISGERVLHFDYNDYCRVEYFMDLDILKLLGGEEGSRYFHK